jgi:hypothetical protein
MKNILLVPAALVATMTIGVSTAAAQEPDPGCVIDGSPTTTPRSR